jgi:hypothetical protein
MSPSVSPSASPLGSPSVSPSAASGPVLTRRGLLASSAVLALLVAGCTPSSGGRKDATVTNKQADALAAQVPVQEQVVAAYAAARTSDPALGAQVADLATQAGKQLDRLKAAAPGASSRSGSASGTATAAVPAGQDPRAWLRTQVAAAVDSHTTVCLEQTGARAALLGSIAAGLRGQIVELS